MAGGAVTVAACGPDVLAAMFAGRATRAQFVAVGGWFFEAFKGDSSSGGFWVIPRPAGAELHTELKLRGTDAIAAAEILKRILANDFGVSRLTGYVLNENRAAKIFAAKIGFRRVAVDDAKTYYEQWLQTK